MILSKPELRVQLKSRRRELSADEVETLSQKVIDQCTDLILWQRIQTLHTYVPVGQENEINSLLLLQYVWQKHPSVQTVVPSLNSKGEYDSVVVTAQTEWQTSGVRIPRPKSGKILKPDQQFDVIIVPMLGFDDEGHRLGHGKGWYDRFLAGQGQAITIGVCYELGRMARGLPHEPHDIPLQYIVTEKSTRHV